MDELDESLAAIYEREGLKGLTALPHIGIRMAEVIASLLEGPGAAWPSRSAPGGGFQ